MVDNTNSTHAIKEVVIKLTRKIQAQHKLGSKKYKVNDILASKYYTGVPAGQKQCKTL